MEDLSAALASLRPRLRRFAYGLCGSLEDADDLVQNAYTRALTRLDQWQPGTSLDSWMFRIVQTTWFNEVKARGVRKRYLDTVDSPTSSPDRSEGILTYEAVRKFIATLPHDQRAALLLVAVEGLSYQDASTALGISAGTLTSRVARARAAIRNHMNADPADGQANTQETTP